MALKKKHEEHENHERWLVSYADFITLLFAFFTVLYATSHVDKQKLQQMVEAMNHAFGGGSATSSLDSPDADAGGPDLATARVEAATGRRLDGRKSSGHLGPYVVQIGLVDQTLTLDVPERVLFAPGASEIHPSALVTLGALADAVSDLPVVVTVTGQADGSSIAPGGRWRDNWELATARGAATVRYLESRGVPTAQLRASARLDSRAQPNDWARAVTFTLDTGRPEVAHLLLDRFEAAFEANPTTP